MINVVEYVRETTQKLQSNQYQLQERFEPHLQLIKGTLSDRVYKPINSQLQRFGFDIVLNPPEVVELKQTDGAKLLCATMLEHIGQELSVSEWMTIDQEMVNRFAAVTGDDQWIHTSPERAKAESPFRGTIAHGYLTLSVIPKLTQMESLIKSYHAEIRMIVNLGLNNVRFSQPVKTGSDIRARTSLKELIKTKRGADVVFEVAIETKHQSNTTCCVAETVVRIIV